MVSQRWDLDPEPFEGTVHSCFGQVVPLVDGQGAWNAQLHIEHLGYGIKTLHWGQAFHANPLVEWLYRSCVIERIQTHIDVRPLFSLAPHLANLKLKAAEKCVAPALLDWASAVIASARASRRSHLITGPKALYQWAVEELLPGFSEADLQTLDTTYSRKKLGSAVTLLDDDQGPFTAKELIRIEQALQANVEWRRDRAMYYLCRDWGLRPIQLALLRVADLGSDAGGPYIRVPSVKGIRRSRLRRSEKNMKKRYLSDEAASAIADYVENNHEEVRRIQLKVASDNNLPTTEVEKLPIPLFPGTRSGSRIRRFYTSPSLRSYILHSDSHRFSAAIRKWGDMLKLPARYNGVDDQEISQMEFSAYRFRRTKATVMVISGHSPEDVAEALDHQTTENVKHYFKFNLDLIEFVNAAHNTSAEIAEAIAYWSGRITSAARESLSKEMHVANLGICKATEVCPHHPTVTCYSCPKFRPFKEADHRVAKRVIEDLRDRMREQGSGPVRSQVDSALAGVRAVIKAIAHDA